MLDECYNVVKHYIISLGLNLEVYGFENEYIDLPSALLYRSANNILANPGVAQRRFTIAYTFRKLARLIEQVRKTRMMMDSCEVDTDCSPTAWHRNLHRAWRREQTAMNNLADYLWSLHRSQYANVRIVRTARTSRYFSTLPLTHGKMSKALWDSWGNEPVFLDVRFSLV